MLKAEQKGIQLNLNILYDKLDFLSDMDLTTIVSNLLDNAIEAVSELDKDRTVLFVIEEQMTVKKYNGIWKATVENNSFVVSITIPIDSQPSL